MSYTPGTKLSHSEVEKATVITQGYLMPTQGKYAGQRMLVADWVILADGATIYEDYIPLGPEAVAPEAIAPETIRSEALAPEALEPLPRSQTSSIETETFAHCLHPHSLTPLPRSRTSSVETEACGCEEVVREFLPVAAPTPPPTKPRPNYNHVNWPSPMPSLLAQSLGIASQRPTHQRALEMLARRFNCSVEVFLQTNWKQLNLNYSAAELMRKCGNNRYRY
jgi:hypothetical protein